MIAYPPSLQGVAGSKTGIAPVHLLDVYDMNGYFYYWASRKFTALARVDAQSVAGNAPVATPTYLPWILNVPQWKFNRSLSTDMGMIEIQCLSGDTLQRDFEKIVRSTALEGALFVYRMWAADAEAAYLEVHGTLSVAETDPYTARLSCKQLLNPSSDITPMYDYSETCQWRWSSKQCGSTQSAPCQQSFLSCQVVERIAAISNSYEKNFGEASANVATGAVNRLRQY